MLTIKSRKLLSQIANGEDFSANLSDFTTNLTGGVMERVRMVIEVDYSQVSEAESTTNEWEITTANTLTRLNGTSWKDEGWHVGDKFDFSSPSHGVVAFSGEILTITGPTMTFSVDSGTAGNHTYTDARMEINTITEGAALWRFGLPENDDLSDNYDNIVDGSVQSFTVSGITTSFKTMTPAPGAKSWITGDARIKVGTLTAGAAVYTIEQDFIILPFYLAEIEGDIINSTNPSALFGGNNSIKFIWDFELRHLLSDPNNAQRLSDNETLGSVGWFGENYNGGASNYGLDPVTYSDGATGLQPDKVTTVTTRITSDGLFTSSSKVGIYFALALSPNEYTANSTPFTQLWMYDNHVKQVGAEYSGLAGIIKRIKLTLVDADNIDVEFDTQFTTQQQSRLNDGSPYILAIQTASPALSRGSSDSVILLADFGAMSLDSDVPGLLDFQDLRFFGPADTTFIGGATQVRGWNEDGILAQLLFSLDISKGARLRELRMKLIATDGTNEFSLQDYALNLASGILKPVGGGLSKQAFTLEASRGFSLAANSPFNRVRLREYVYDPSYLSVLTAADNAGFVVPSPEVRRFQSDLITYFKVIGLFALADVIYIFRHDGSENFGRINIKNPSQLATLVNSPTFIANRGFQGNGTDAHILTGLNPTIGANNYTQDSASRIMYGEMISGSGVYLDGIADDAAIGVNALRHGSSDENRINQGTTDLDSAVTLSLGQGFRAIYRASDSDVVIADGSDVFEREAVSEAMYNGEQAILRSGNAYGSHVIGIYIMGANMAHLNNQIRQAIEAYVRATS